MKNEEDKDKVFKLIQQFLTDPPTLIWGSGATIPFGIPSMEELKKSLDIKEGGNLEEILSNLDDDEQLNQHKQKIFEIVNKKDLEIRKNVNKSTFQSLKKLIEVFYRAEPQNINIITTNYDCVMEYCLSYLGYPFSDGFSGREFSVFNEKLFKYKGHINLFKVHGSLRWTEIDGQCRYSNSNQNMKAIFPTKKKYEEGYKEPFRSLITKSDEIIQNSKSFLVIGFGFNDEHLTPKIRDKISEDSTPIVVVTKQATETCRDELRNAKKYIIVEQKPKKTLVSYLDKNENESRISFKGDYWRLENFVEII